MCYYTSGLRKASGGQTGVKKGGDYVIWDMRVGVFVGGERGGVCGIRRQGPRFNGGRFLVCHDDLAPKRGSWVNQGEKMSEPISWAEAGERALEILHCAERRRAEGAEADAAEQVCGDCAEKDAEIARLQRAGKAEARWEAAGECQSCGEPLSRDCPRCKGLWES